ncbi:MAG: diaminopimelate decarboxylase [archaeon]|nr:MAG: diaminopimelate decarboxylase [archaeon]
MTKEILIESAKKYGTPLYVYDGDLIVKRYKELHEFIKWPKLKIYYAMKANYNFEILKLLNQHGAHIDAVSPGDVLLALKAGFSPDKILFTANKITDAEMLEVSKLGVLFNIGSLSRLEKYGKEFPGKDICIRFNSNVVAGEHENVRTGGESTKFGILLNKVEKVKEIVKKYDLKVIGLHEHTGSGIPETTDVIKGMVNLLTIATKENFPDLEFIDFGGGFKVPYSPEEKRINYEEFGKEITRVFSEFCKEYGRELKLCFEPGKYVVAEAGNLVIETTTIKENNGKLIAGTNSGFPQLIRPMFYQAYHHILNLTNSEGELKEYDVCGNICETGDCFAVNRELPEIREGDLLTIQNAGAYCYSMGGLYNLRPMPAEVLVLNGETKLARKRLSNEEMVQQIIEES